MPIIPVGEFLPDMPDFNNPGSALVQNVIPKTIQSYGPLGGLASQFTPLNGRCQGAIGVRDSGGIAHAFAGTANKIYHLIGGATSWVDVSGAAYSLDNPNYWSTAQFGEKIIFTQIADPPQRFTMNASGAFADITAPSGTNGIAPPKAKFVCVAKDFVLYGNTQDPTDGVRNQRVWWPAINTDGDFYLPGSAEAIAVQSDRQDVAGDHGELTGLVGGVGPVDAAAFFQRAVVRMMYAGSPNIWDFMPAHGARGCIAPQSLRVTEKGAIYLAEDGFYLFDGQQSIPIGFQKIDKFFYQNVDQSAIHHVNAAIDPINKLYFVAFPSRTCPDGFCDSLLICNYMLPSILQTPGRWAFATGVNTEFLFKSMSFGYTLDQMDIFGPLDQLADSLDSRVWTGDKEILTAFDWSHMMNYFTGPNMPPLIETSESQPIQGKRSFITNSIPLVDGDTPSVIAGNRVRLEDPVIYTSAAVMQPNGYAPLMSYGRYHRFRISLNQGTTFSNIQGVDIPDEALTDAGMV